MSKYIVMETSAVDKLEKGIDKLANVVKTTLGPRGRTVILERPDGKPTITNDGVSIAKEITLKDPIENLGATLIKEVAMKANDVAGDGTTTATILAQALVKEGLRMVKAGTNPVFLKKGMDITCKNVVATLKDMSKAVESSEEIAQVASVSSGDEEIGNLISDAMAKVGKTGVVTLQDGNGLDVTLEVAEGMSFDSGHLSPYLVWNPSRMETVLENPFILITNKRVNAVTPLMRTLERIISAGRDLLIIADDVEGEMLATLIMGKARGSMNNKIIGVKAPEFSDRRIPVLEDMAIMTGGTVVTGIAGIDLADVDLPLLGNAERVIVTSESTTIVGGAGSPEAINTRVIQLQKQLAEATHEYDKTKLTERIAKLTGGIAVIKVGGATETEMKDKKLRIEDALNATRSAVEEGVVAGGGTTLLRLSDSIDLDAIEASHGMEARIGANAVKKALQYPVKQIAENSGVSGDIVVSKCVEMGGNVGYNALTGNYEDMLEAGILDPTKVTRSAIQNAISIAGMILTTSAVVAQDPDVIIEGQQPGGMF